MANWTRRADLRWENWGDPWSIYQTVSGETHFLNPLGAAILAYLESKPTALEGLCEHLSMEFGCLSVEDLRAQVASSLMRFEELGLIQCQQCSNAKAA